jgi:cellulose synthase operon protein YhjQ
LKTIAFVSLKGGVGRTTLAANIGAALAQESPDEVLVIDFDPRNQLGLHLGLPAGERAGLGRASLQGAGWDQVVRRRMNGSLAWIPFGELNEAEHRELEQRLAREPDFIENQLGERLMQQYRYVVFDTAPGPCFPWQQILPAADLVIGVLLADPASFATLPALSAQLRAHCPQQPGFAGAHLLLNSVDSLALSRDVRALVAAQHLVTPLPFVVHQDEAVRESLASQRPVIESAGSSQAAVDLRQLTGWIRETLVEEARDREQPGAERIEPPLRAPTMMPAVISGT